MGNLFFFDRWLRCSFDFKISAERILKIYITKDRIMVQSYILIGLVILLCGFEAEGYTIAARGMFSRNVPVAESLTANSCIQFTWSDPSVTNSEFFALENGNIRVKKAGVYRVIADTTITGAAQMRFKINSTPMTATTVGTDRIHTSMLEAENMLYFAQDNMYISWCNPSGHTVLIGDYNDLTYVHLVIFGVEGVQGSANIGDYFEATRESTTFEFAPTGWTVWSNTDGLTFNQGDDIHPTQLFLRTGRTYLVSYSFAPTGILLPMYPNLSHPGLRSFPVSTYEQVYSKGIAVTTSPNDCILNFAALFTVLGQDGLIEFREYDQDKYIGGSAVTYNRISVIELDNFDTYSNFVTLLPPNPTYDLSVGDRLPLEQCIGECQNIALTPYNSWNYTANGIYYISMTFPILGAGTFYYKRDGYSYSMHSTVKKHEHGQNHGSYLVQGSYIIDHHYLETEDSCQIVEPTQPTGGTPNIAIVSVVVIRIA